MGAKGVAEHLLEARRDRELVFLGARPERRLAGRARRDREEVRAGQLPAEDQFIEREATIVVLLIEQGQAREIHRRSHRSRIDLLLGQQRAIGGDIARNGAEQIERLARTVAGLAGLQQPVEWRREEALRLGFGRRRQDVMHRKSSLVSVRLSVRSEEHTSELQSHVNLVCRLLLEKKKE